jgi:hypothetical protein
VKTGDAKYDIALYFNVEHFLISAYIIVALDAMVWSRCT